VTHQVVAEASADNCDLDHSLSQLIPFNKYHHIMYTLHTMVKQGHSWPYS